MDYAVVMAGGTGKRLWPLSRPVERAVIASIKTTPTIGSQISSPVSRIGQITNSAMGQFRQTKTTVIIFLAKCSGKPNRLLAR